MLLLVLVTISCDKDNEKPSKVKLLTNGSTKSWNITNETPPDDDADCRPDSEFLVDNSWNFSADGSFTFDHGTVTEGTSCSDLINLTGNWSFEDGGSKLHITLDHATDNPQLVFNDETFFSLDIKSLTATKLIVTEIGTEITFTAK
jgi:hypothetical protein